MARPPSSRGGRDPARELFIRRTAAALSLSPGDVEGALSVPRRPSVRINTLRAADPEATLEELRALDLGLEAIPWCPGGFHLDGDKARLVASPLFREGRVFIQNASSFIPPIVLDPQPGERILDVCAAPGGKSAHVAALTGNHAELWLNDALRLDKLIEVTTLLGVHASSLTAHPGQYIDKFIDGPFDRILLDAQCGGEGMIDLSHPNALRFWSMARVTKYHHMQRSMVNAAFRLLKPGGVLVYSTCTFAPEEDEEPVAHLVKHQADAEVVPIDLPIPNRRPAVLSWEGRKLPPQLAGALRLAPSPWFEGFFVCRIRKSAALRPPVSGL
ncbi:rRNA cytosine-C5-methyltransferase [Deltaproteobacteria bacterium]|nr:rRNA cytosine-C5-methyltransferase [Deltaproteobacteria bacterium]